MSKVTMREMLDSGVHFGHKARYWNPKMEEFIFGVRQKLHIINLEKTLPLFENMVKFVADVAARRGKILFVGTKYQASDIIREEATRCGMPYVDHRWLGGMLTNYKTIRQSIRRLNDLDTRFQNGEFDSLTKNERLQLLREKTKLEFCLAGIRTMGGLPDALFVIDVMHEKIALREAQRLSIPIAAIVDSNCSPDGIDYPVPGNDDSMRAIRLYCRVLADAIIEARGDLEETVMKEAGKTDDEEAPRVVKKIITRKATTVVKQLMGDSADLDEDVEDEDAAEEALKTAKPAAQKPVEKTLEKPAVRTVMKPSADKPAKPAVRTARKKAEKTDAE